MIFKGYVGAWSGGCTLSGEEQMRGAAAYGRTPSGSQMAGAAAAGGGQPPPAALLGLVLLRGG